MSLEFSIGVRLTHFNFLLLSLLVRSGIEILGAHPKLYWRDHCSPASEWLRFTRKRMPDDALWTAEDEVQPLSPWLAFQQLTYFLLVFGLTPLQILTGLAMSPALAARFPRLSRLLGGHQTARSVHLLGLVAFVLFFVVHVALVIAHGFGAGMEAIVLGREVHSQSLAVLLGACGIAFVVASNIVATRSSLRWPSATKRILELGIDPLKRRTYFASWAGVSVAYLLEQARPNPAARYLVFHTLDEKWERPGHGDYYEVIDLGTARAPQVILAYEMNGGPLPVEHGAPLRLRVEHQLGYKMAKWINRIELVEEFRGIGKGQGGWRDDVLNYYPADAGI